MPDVYQIGSSSVQRAKGYFRGFAPIQYRQILGFRRVDGWFNKKQLIGLFDPLEGGIGVAQGDIVDIPAPLITDIGAIWNGVNSWAISWDSTPANGFTVQQIRLFVRTDSHAEFQFTTQGPGNQNAYFFDGFPSDEIARGETVIFRLKYLTAERGLGPFSSDAIGRIFDVTPPPASPQNILYLKCVEDNTWHLFGLGGTIGDLSYYIGQNDVGDPGVGWRGYVVVESSDLNNYTLSVNKYGGDYVLAKPVLTVEASDFNSGMPLVLGSTGDGNNYVVGFNTIGGETTITIDDTPV